MLRTRAIIKKERRAEMLLEQSIFVRGCFNDARQSKGLNAIEGSRRSHGDRRVFSLQCDRRVWRSLLRSLPCAAIPSTAIKGCARRSNQRRSSLSYDALRSYNQSKGVSLSHGDRSDHLQTFDHSCSCYHGSWSRGLHLARLRAAGETPIDSAARRGYVSAVSRAGRRRCVFGTLRLLIIISTAQTGTGWYGAARLIVRDLLFVIIDNKQKLRFRKQQQR
jgi:hypothetical protein